VQNIGQNGKYLIKMVGYFLDEDESANLSKTKLCIEQNGTNYRKKIGI
jgi:hypothetical protein